MAPLLPPSPPSGSPRLLKSGSGSEWSVVVQSNVKSSLLLLLAISTVAAFSILYSSRSLTVARTAGEALTQSPLLAALDLSSRMPEDDDDQSDEPAEVVSLPAAAPSTGEAAMQLEEKCDISRGKWVREPNGPVYTNLTCPMLPDFKNCQKFGKDDAHLYWRWQPDGCELPRFVPERFLDVVRGKRLAFIGDSLARNQIDSLLCLLSQVCVPCACVYASSSGLLDKQSSDDDERHVVGRGARGRVLGRVRQVPDMALPGAQLHAHGLYAGFTAFLRTIALICRFIKLNEDADKFSSPLVLKVVEHTFGVQLESNKMIQQPSASNCDELPTNFAQRSTRNIQIFHSRTTVLYAFN
ncbi:hypothetical protein TRIUR3_17928 [Triticum urartu]|uniref:Uncharacterized protein n=1 Tax=Triticum urartu TaxID=4572 RepID=M7YDN2_TRIUA|nr:hypothetical protein TRIUR3_17928 [Triticum urartu]